MHKFLNTAGAASLALAMSGVPLLAAHAAELPGSAIVQAGEQGDGTYNGQMHPIMRVAANGPLASSTAGHPALNPRLPEQSRPILEQERSQASTSLRVNMPGEEMQEGAQVQEQERVGSSSLQSRIQEIIQKREEMLASSTEDGHGNATSTAARLRNIARFAAHMDELFGSSTPVQDLAQLRQSIQEREQATQQLLASSTPREQKILEHASKVSIAVHALLASKDLVGSTTGQSISQLAQQVNDSLASSTDAQAQIEARGFWTKLFFGGDSKAAQTLAETAAQNQERIQQMTDLLSQASTSADVKATLQVQLQQLENAQASTTELANQQKGLWGLLSWRLF